MGSVERVQSQLWGRRDPEDAEGHDKAAPRRRPVSAVEGDQVVRQRKSVLGEQADHRLPLVVIVGGLSRTRVPKWLALTDERSRGQADDETGEERFMREMRTQTGRTWSVWEIKLTENDIKLKLRISFISTWRWECIIVGYRKRVVIRVIWQYILQKNFVNNNSDIFRKRRAVAATIGIGR